ncbi:ComEC/Rec2 family competence protein [Psychroflexus tropicus]|uniref:ComEC/Rec2 family competence protein n=1 Tax=Psychroflexus tropicus TaxID=197345 RepID=UPI00052456D0|nr:ComEC/Rec2 family competence protein [Psychroflexus tropicus]
MKYVNHPLLQICLVFILGIWFGFTDFNFEFRLYVYVSVTIFLLFSISLLLARRFSSFKIVYTVIAILLVFSLGVFNTKVHEPENQPNHFTQQLEEEALDDNSLVSFKGNVVRRLKSNAFKDKYELSLVTLEGRNIKGKLLLQVEASQQVDIRSNSVVFGLGTIKAFQDPSNPQQFNYKDYMATLQMSHVIDTERDFIQVEDLVSFSMIGFGEAAREEIISALGRHEFSQEQLSLIQALLLGQKQNIDPDTYNEFSKAGVVHILAVSGLHVGIVLIILQFITKALLRVRNGKIIRTILVVIGIWGFAALAGFSTSVLRAAVMFSLLSIALNSRRKTSTVNTLAISAVILLIYNPYFIFQVGFQLSYLAVISIVTLQPRLFKLYKPRYIIDKRIWEIVTVTVAAQAGVLPLSLYYFHQFPGLFLLSNLVILPGLGLLLGGGILIIFLSLVGLLPDLLTKAYGFLLDLLIAFVNWIGSKDDLIFSDIFFTKPMLISSLMLLLSLFVFNSKRKGVSYVFLNLSLLALMLCMFIEKQNQLQQEEVVIFQAYQQSQLGIVKGKQLQLYTDQPLLKDSIMEQYHIANYKTLRGIKTISISDFEPVYELNPKEYLLVLDSLPAYPKNSFQPAYLLLKNSPDINLDRVISDLKPKQIIADASNYKSDIDRWKCSAKKAGISLHSTWEKGAFKLVKD